MFVKLYRIETTGIFEGITIFVLHLMCCLVDVVERPSRKSSSHKAEIIVGVAIAVLVILIIAAGVAIYFYRKHKHLGRGYKPTNTKAGIV